jgi:predicted secreted protein
MSQLVQTKVGEIFEVALPVTAGTGFRWEVTSPPLSNSIISLVEETRDVPTLTPGAGTVQRFRFRASAPGTVELAFAYRRVWQSGAAADKKAFMVQIDPAG